MNQYLEKRRCTDETFKLQIVKTILARRLLAMLTAISIVFALDMHAAPAVSAMNKEYVVMPLAADKNILLAQFGFDEGFELLDSSVNNVNAELVDPNCIIGSDTVVQERVTAILT